MKGTLEEADRIYGQIKKKLNFEGNRRRYKGSFWYLSNQPDLNNLPISSEVLKVAYKRIPEFYCENQRF